MILCKCFVDQFKIAFIKGEKMFHNKKIFRVLAFVSGLSLYAANVGIAHAGLFGLGNDSKGLPAGQVVSDIDAGQGAEHYKWDRDYAHLLEKATNGFFIAGFQVKYIYGGGAAGTTSGSSSTRAVGGGYVESSWRAGQKVDMQVELQGVSDADLQALTDKLYADFKQRLQASGLKLVSDDKLKDNPAYTQLSTAANPFVSDDTLHGRGKVRHKTFSPSALPLFFFNGQGNMGAFGLENNKVIGNLSRELNAIALMPRLTLTFMKLQSSGNHVYIPVAAEVKVDEAAYVSKLYFDTALVWTFQDNPVAADGGMLTLKNDIAMAGSIGEFKDTTSAETKQRDDTLNSVKTGLAIFSGLLGRPSAGTQVQHKTVALVTTPEKFGAVVEQGAQATTRLFVDALKNTK